MDVKVPGPPPAAEVIDIEVLRHGRLMRGMQEKCSHHRITIDPVLTEIECRDCKAKLNPVGWLADHFEYWEYVKRCAQDYHREREMLEDRKVTRCEHCLKMTRIRRISNAALTLLRRAKQTVTPGERGNG